MVVSVGPYTFHTDWLLPSNFRASSRESASPPQMTLSCLLGHPAWSSIRQLTGVACITVAPLFSIAARKLSPSEAISRVTISTLAPVISGRKSSCPDMSKDRVVIPIITSSLVTTGTCPIKERKLTTHRYSHCTPLGLPVEPGVYSV